jgi:hypothetical protein
MTMLRDATAQTGQTGVEVLDLAEITAQSLRVVRNSPGMNSPGMNSPGMNAVGQNG